MIESFEYKNHTVEIHVDESPESPRQQDNLGTMVCFHNCYSLGDKGHGYKHGDFSGFEELYQQIMKDHRPAAIVFIYMMDHSGISISSDAQDFRVWDSEGWDWGQIGFAFVSREKVLKKYGKKELSVKIKQKALSALLLEIETYNQYLQGEVYGFVIKDANGEHVDSCWGFYEFDHCRGEAKDAVDCIALKV